MRNESSPPQADKNRPGVTIKSRKGNDPGVQKHSLRQQYVMSAGQLAQRGITEAACEDSRYSVAPASVLTAKHLARRWHISHRTLERWRSENRGPPYLRVMGRVLYRLSDIETYETAHLRQLPGDER